MGDRHWPEDADEAVEELETENATLRAEVERLRACLIHIRTGLLSQGRRPEECQQMCDIDAALTKGEG